ncbi:hypothetical protein C8F01DRAFT_1338629 [Mycena amicta]|nr:hypothetical protein C8F01DRAFT_1338629 [Mycena amicta]
MLKNGDQDSRGIWKALNRSESVQKQVASEEWKSQASVSRSRSLLPTAMSPTLTHSAPWPPGSPATQRIPSGAERSTESMSRSDWVDGGFTYVLRSGASRPQIGPPSLGSDDNTPRRTVMDDGGRSARKARPVGQSVRESPPSGLEDGPGADTPYRGRGRPPIPRATAFTHVKRTYVSDWQLTDGILQELGSDSPTARCVPRQKPRLPLAATFEGRVDSVFSRLDAISSLIRVSQSLRIVSIVADDSLTDLRVLHTFRAFRCRTHEGTYLTSSRLLSRLDSYDPLTTTDADYRILVGVDGAVSRAADGWQTTNGSYTRGTRRSPLPQGLGPQAHHHRPCPVSAAFDQKSLTKTMHKNRQTRVLLDNAPAHVGIPRGSKKAHTGVLVVGASRPAVLVLQELPRIHNAPWTKRPISKSTASRPDVVDGRAVYIDETTLSHTGHAFLASLVVFRLPASSGLSRPETPHLRWGRWSSSRAWVALGLGRREGSGRAFVVMLLVHPMVPRRNPAIGSLGRGRSGGLREIVQRVRISAERPEHGLPELRRPARSTVTVSVRRRYINADAKEVEVESQGEGEVWLPSKLVFIYCAALASKAAGPQFTKEKRYPILAVEWLSKSSLQELSVRVPFQGPRDLLLFRLHPICARGRCTSSHRGRSSESGDGWWAAASRWHNRVLDAMPVLPELHAAPNPHNLLHRLPLEPLPYPGPPESFPASQPGMDDECHMSFVLGDIQRQVRRLKRTSSADAAAHALTWGTANDAGAPVRSPNGARVVISVCVAPMDGVVVLDLAIPLLQQRPFRPAPSVRATGHEPMRNKEDGLDEAEDWEAAQKAADVGDSELLVKQSERTSDEAKLGYLGWLRMPSQRPAAATSDGTLSAEKGIGGSEEEYGRGTPGPANDRQRAEARAKWLAQSDRRMHQNAYEGAGRLTCSWRTAGGRAGYACGLIIRGGGTQKKG